MVSLFIKDIPINHYNHHSYYPILQRFLICQMCPNYKNAPDELLLPIIIIFCTAAVTDNDLCGIIKCL